MRRHLPTAILMTIASLACASAPVRRAAIDLVVEKRVDHVDVVAREPMFVEHPGGALFLAGYGGPQPTLWTSRDRGAAWSRVELGEQASGNSDVDLAVAADGTVYFVTMTYDRQVNEGRGISMGISRDAGATWSWTAVSRSRFDDRPWVEVAPDGTAHLIWNDGGGVKHRVSHDAGRSWVTLPDVHDKGGSSHLAIGPSGEVAVRVTPLSASYNRFDAGVDLIAVSGDGGRSWTKRTAPGERDWGPTWDAKGYTPRWVEPLAFDARGRLYSLWTDKRGVHIVRSTDRGATWTPFADVKTEALAFFPYLAARGDGELAATWFTAALEDFGDLRAHLAVIGGGGVVRRAEAWTLESARASEAGGKVQNDPGGEYLAVAFLRDGTLTVAAPIQNKPAERMGFTFWRFRARD
jgi:hypothetical protein